MAPHISQRTSLTCSPGFTSVTLNDHSFLKLLKQAEQSALCMSQLALWSTGYWSEAQFPHKAQVFPAADKSPKQIKDGIGGNINSVFSRWIDSRRTVNGWISFGQFWSNMLRVRHSLVISWHRTLIVTIITKRNPQTGSLQFYLGTFKDDAFFLLVTHDS